MKTKIFSRMLLKAKNQLIKTLCYTNMNIGVKINWHSLYLWPLNLILTMFDMFMLIIDYEIDHPSLGNEIFSLIRTWSISEL